MYQPHVWREIDQRGTYVDLSTHLMDQRTILVGSEVTSDIASVIAMQMLTLARHSEPIHLYINCHGGSVPAGLAIVDMTRFIQSRGVTVHTYCLGECLGVAAAILASGTPKERHAFSSGRVSLFQEWYGVETLYGHQVQSVEDERERQMGAVLKALVDADVRPPPVDGVETEDPEKNLRQLLRTQHFLGADDAVAYGIADEVVTTTSRVPTATLGEGQCLERT